MHVLDGTGFHFYLFIFSPIISFVDDGLLYAFTSLSFLTVFFAEHAKTFK